MRGIGDHIKSLRNALDVNQAEFARLVGVSQGTVSKWESGAQEPDVAANIKITQLAKKALADNEQNFPAYYDGDLVGNSKSRKIKVLGYLQKGEKRNELNWSDDQIFEIAIPVPYKYSHYNVKAYEVRGQFVDKKYIPGSIVVFREIAGNEQLYEEEFVIVQTIYDDETAEFACWRMFRRSVKQISISSYSKNLEISESHVLSRSESTSSMVKGRKILGAAVASVHFEQGEEPAAR